MDLKADFRTLHTYPSKKLREVARPVTEFDTTTLRNFAGDLATACQKFAGIGIAAPQVGVDWRVIVLRADVIGGAPKDVEYVCMVNPEILEASTERVTNIEGCLSFPGCYEAVTRSAAIRVRFQDLSGKEREISARAMQAQVIQHEVDHLDGKLFVDYLSTLKRNLITKYAKKGFPNFADKTKRLVETLMEKAQKEAEAAQAAPPRP